jgi:hypothetical protein
MLAHLDVRNRALLGDETVFSNVPFVAYEPGADPLNPEISPPYVYELLYTDQWDLVQLPHGDGEVAPQLDTPLVGYSMPLGKSQPVNYIGSDGHIHELVQNDVTRCQFDARRRCVRAVCCAVADHAARQLHDPTITGDKLVTHTSLSSPR